MREQQQDKIMKDPERRKIVKAMVGSAAALTAYHILPTDWSKPIVEQILLPAHAQTSGVSLNDPCTVQRVQGNVTPGVDLFVVEGFVTPATAGLTTNISIRTFASSAPGATIGTNSGTTTTLADGTFQLAITGFVGGSADSVEAVTTVTGATGSATCSDTQVVN